MFLHAVSIFRILLDTALLVNICFPVLESEASCRRNSRRLGGFPGEYGAKCEATTARWRREGLDRYARVPFQPTGLQPRATTNSLFVSVEITLLPCLEHSCELRMRR